MILGISRELGGQSGEQPGIRKLGHLDKISRSGARRQYSGYGGCLACSLPGFHPQHCRGGLGNPLALQSLSSIASSALCTEPHQISHNIHTPKSNHITSSTFLFTCSGEIVTNLFCSVKFPFSISKILVLLGSFHSCRG